MRRFFELVRSEPRVDATAIQTVGIKGYDGLAIVRVTMRQVRHDAGRSGSSSRRSGDTTSSATRCRSPTPSWCCAATTRESPSAAPSSFSRAGRRSSSSPAAWARSRGTSGPSPRPTSSRRSPSGWAFRERHPRSRTGRRIPARTFIHDALLAARGLDPRSFILVQKPYMERRTFATFMKVWPEKRIVVTSPQVSFDEYLEQVLARHAVARRGRQHHGRRSAALKLYAEKGFQIPQEIPRTCGRVRGARRRRLRHAPRPDRYSLIAALVANTSCARRPAPAAPAKLLLRRRRLASHLLFNTSTAFSIWASRPLMKSSGVLSM